MKARPRSHSRRPGRPPLPRRPLEWGLALLAGALVVIAITSLGSGSSTAAVSRRTATVGKGVVQSTVSGNGTLEPAAKVELNFGAAGEVTAIQVKAGQKVAKGAVLAEIDSSSARASLASAEAKSLEAEEALEAAEEAAGEEGEDEATGKGTPTEGKEEASAPEPSREAASEGAAAGATVSVPTAEANLREAELAVESARQEVRETTLRAPIAGTVTQVSGTVGENVSSESSGSAAVGTSEAAAGGLGAGGGETGESSSGSAFMTLAQVRRLKMEVSFSESDIGKVRKGQSATVSIDALEGIELAGRVSTVSVLPSEGSSSVVEYPATIVVTQSAKGVRAGMSAGAEVVVEQVKNAITVPSEAISAVGGKTVTVEANGKEVTKSVSTGLVGDETTQVISGLKAGETLVLPAVTVAGAGRGGEGGASESGGFPGGFAGRGGAGFPLRTGAGFPGGRLP